MTALSVFSPAATRRLTPGLIILALIAFVLPFLALTANVDRVAGDFAAARSLTLAGLPSSPAQCFADYRSKVPVAFSGMGLALGADPAVDSAVPQACRDASLTVVPSSLGDATQMNVGWQPAVFAAAILLLLALIIVVSKWGARLTAATVLLVAVLAVLVAGHGAAAHLALMRAGDSPPDIALTGGITAGAGYGYLIELFLVGLVTLHLAGVQVMRFLGARALVVRRV